MPGLRKVGQVYKYSADTVKFDLSMHVQTLSKLPIAFSLGYALNWINTACTGSFILPLCRGRARSVTHFGVTPHPSLEKNCLLAWNLGLLPIVPKGPVTQAHRWPRPKAIRPH